MNSQKEQDSKTERGQLIRYRSCTMTIWQCTRFMPVDHSHRIIMKKWLAFAGSLIFLAAGFASDLQSPKISSATEAVRMLSHPRFIVREAAMQWLWEAGDKVGPALEKAARHSDREVALRAQILLDRLALGIRPDTPPEVMHAIQDYRQGTAKDKAETLKKLLKERRSKIALRLIEFRLRNNESWIHDQVELIVPHLVLTGKLDTAESVLKKAAIKGKKASLYRGFLLATGRLPSAISELEREVANQPDLQKLSELALLYRTHGDLPKAIETARLVADRNHGILELLLTETEQFTELAQRLESRLDLSKTPDRSQLSRYGYLLSFFDEAGNSDAAEKLTKKMSQWYQDLPKSKPFISRILLANGRFDQAIEQLRRDEPMSYFNLLGQFERWDEVMNWLGIEDFNDPKLDDWFATRLEKAGQGSRKSPDEFKQVTDVCRMLARVGRKDLAARFLDRLADGLKQLPTHLWINEVLSVVGIELDLSLRDQAFDHAKLVVGKGTIKAITEALFPDDQDLAVFWWNVLRRDAPKSSLTETLDELRRMLELKWDREDVLQKIRQYAANHAAGRVADLSEDLPHLIESLRRYRWPDEAIELLRKHDQKGTYSMMLGDILASQDKWHAAAETYAKVTVAQPASALAFLLESLTAEKAGERERSIQRKQMSDLLLLEPLDRLAIGDQLIHRHWHKEAVRQWTIVIQIVNPDSGNDATYGYTLRKLYQSDISAEVPLNLRLLAWRWTLWRTMEPEMFVSNLKFYPYFVFHIRLDRAMKKLEQGEVDAAMADAQAAMSAAPSGIEVGESFVPALEKRMQQVHADRLFEQLDEVMTRICKRFPDAALYLNNLAWLYARSNRQLPKALTLAKRAVELEPESATYMDTLAEVHFRVGNRDEAIRLMQRCINIDPHQHHYQVQRLRFQQEKPPANKP